MNAGWVVPVLLLSLACALLLWRVWRLEDSAAKTREMAGRGISAEEVRRTWEKHKVELRADLLAAGSYDVNQLRIDLANRLSEVSKNQHALARALGYEWKRTDAKEGWERTYAHVKLDNIPIGNNPAVVYHYYAKPKPDLTYTANAQGADGKVRKVSSKKPRRAH